MAGLGCLHAMPLSSQWRFFGNASSGSRATTLINLHVFILLILLLFFLLLLEELQILLLIVNLSSYSAKSVVQGLPMALWRRGLLMDSTGKGRCSSHFLWCCGPTWSDRWSNDVAALGLPTTNSSSVGILGRWWRVCLRHFSALIYTLIVMRLRAAERLCRLLHSTNRLLLGTITVLDEDTDRHVCLISYLHLFFFVCFDIEWLLRSKFDAV